MPTDPYCAKCRGHGADRHDADCPHTMIEWSDACRIRDEAVAAERARWTDMLFRFALRWEPGDPWEIDLRPLPGWVQPHLDEVYERANAGEVPDADCP